MKQELLLAIDLPPHSRALLDAAYHVHPAPTAQAREDAARQHGDRIRAIMTNGTTILPAALIEALPQLGIICAQGVGYEGIDPGRRESSWHRGDARTRHERGLRRRPRDGAAAGGAARPAGQLTRWCARAAGATGRTMRPMATGRRLGLLGLGQIGALIARRAAAFDMPVAYHTRHPRPDSGLTYVAACSNWPNGRTSW